VEMKSAVDVDDAQVQRMVEESVEHAFEDLAARRWVEERIRATQTLSATRKALLDAAGDLDDASQIRVQAALAAVESALATENAETKIGDTPLLKTVSTALDEATRPLAELLMDRAMEAMLRKRGLIK
jgi:molecular chaperone DnaK